MTRSRVRIDGVSFPLYSLNTLVIGSGAAGLNAAVRLHAEGQTDVAVVTDRFGGGASRNSGSDKQTYYKLSLAGDRPDSPFEMARDLAAGGGMHGDIALCEALGSAGAFFRLVDLGVPFPQDRYGAFVGYRTDNDPRQRATSAGPLTSRLMFEALAGEVRRRRIPLLDGHEAIALLTAGRAPASRVVGAIALDTRRPPAGTWASSSSTPSTSSWPPAAPAGCTSTPSIPPARTARTAWPSPRAPRPTTSPNPSTGWPRSSSAGTSRGPISRPSRATSRPRRTAATSGSS